MSETKVPTMPRVLVGDIEHVVIGGRKFTNARNAFIAYAVLVLGVSQKSVADSTGVKPSNVSVTIKQAKAITGVLDALTTLDRTGSQSHRIDVAAAIGALIVAPPRAKTTDKATGGTTTDKAIADGASVAVKATAKGKAVPVTREDVIAAISALLMASDPATRANHTAAIQDALNRANRAAAELSKASA